MKKLIFFFAIVIMTFHASAQSFLLTPTDGFLRSSAPDIFLIGTSDIDFRGQTSSGTLATPTASPTNRRLFNIVGQGHTGGGFSTGAQIQLRTTQAWTPTARGTNISFYNTENGTSSLLERMRIEHDGNVGIGSVTPDFPLHLTNSSASISSTTGSFAIGATTGLHLIFDTDEINAYNGVNPGTLYLNPNHNGKIQIGSGSTGNLDVNGFSNLGDGAPAIKMKKFSGTIPLSATTHSIAHGLTKTKILGLQIFVESSVTGSRYLPNDGAAGTPVHYEIQLDNTNIVFQNIGTNLDGEPYIIVVTYEQ